MKSLHMGIILISNMSMDVSEGHDGGYGHVGAPGIGHVGGRDPGP